MRVADAIAKYLSTRGVSQVFMVTGGGAMHLNDAFARNGSFNITYTHHEQAAAIAAEAYARLTGEPAVVNVTSGPGGINALTGVHGAYTDSIPMYVVSGQVKTTTIAALTSPTVRQLGDQEADIISMVKGITKYCRLITDSQSVSTILHDAFEAMISGRPGPVWLDVPIDIQSALVESSLSPTSFSTSLSNDFYSKKLTSTSSNQSFSKNDSKLILETLKRCKRPVVMLGSGSRIGNCVPKMKSFVGKLGLPVVTCWNAHDLISDDDLNYIGRPGTVGDRIGNIAVQNADCVLVLGSRLNIRQISYSWDKFAASAKEIIAVDIDENELNKPTLKITKKINIDLESFFDAFEWLEKFEHPSAKSYLNSLKKVSSLICENDKYLHNNNRLNPYIFLSQLTNAAPDDAVFVCGNGAACVMTFQVAKIKENTRLFTNSGCAAMGYDLPAAIGAALSGKKVICIAGDGSIMMNIQELQTLAYLNLNIKVVILDNGGYLSIRSTQENFFPDNMHGINSKNGVSFPDYTKVARAFGIRSRKISLNNFEQAIQEIHDCDGPFLYQVVVDPDQSFAPKLSAKREADGSISSPDLADMSPFLSSELTTKISKLLKDA